MRAQAIRHTPDFADRVAGFLARGGGRYLCVVAALSVLGAALLGQTAALRYQCETARFAWAERLDGLGSARLSALVSGQMLRESQQVSLAAQARPYLVISITDRRLWYKQGETVLLTARVATGSGKTLVHEQGAGVWKFDTPRGRLVVQSKELNPLWVPPDWFYLEEARKHKLGLVHLEPGRALAAGGGSLIRVEGTQVVRSFPDGRRQVMKPSKQHLIIVDGRVLVPPLGTAQRSFDKVLGTHRLNLGDGYGLHGTNLPETVGQAVSHGCVRLLNEDIAKLYQMVPVGTPVYLY